MTEEGQGKKWYIHFNGKTLSSDSSMLSEEEMRAVNEAMGKVRGSLNQMFTNFSANVKKTVGDLRVNPLHGLSPAQLEGLKSRLPKIKTTKKDGHFLVEMNDEVVMDLKLPTDSSSE